MHPTDLTPTPIRRPRDPDLVEPLVVERPPRAPSCLLCDEPRAPESPYCASCREQLRQEDEELLVADDPDPAGAPVLPGHHLSAAETVGERDVDGPGSDAAHRMRVEQLARGIYRGAVAELLPITSTWDNGRRLAGRAFAAAEQFEAEARRRRNQP